MAGKQVVGDGVPPSLAGMSKNQLYDIMSQMKTLIEQNKDQARQILIQNPVLTRALFQAQIMLGMVQPPRASPVIAATPSQNSVPSTVSNQQPNIQASASFQGPSVQNPSKTQQPNQTISNIPSQTIPPNAQTQAIPSHAMQPKGHHGSQSTPMPIPQPNLTHIASQSAPLHQHPVPPMPSQSQQPGSQYMPPLQQQQQIQPPLPPQPRPQPGFPHQGHPQMGPNIGFQHAPGQQHHHSQHMFHPGTKPPASLGPSFPQGQPPLPNQNLPPSLYQGGSSGHMGMDFNQGGGSKQADRPSNRPPDGGPSSFGGQPSNRQPPLSPEMEKALLQQVMSLTPEQINLLPVEQRSQVLQLQQMLRQ